MCTGDGYGTAFATINSQKAPAVSIPREFVRFPRDGVMFDGPNISSSKNKVGRCEVRTRKNACPRMMTPLTYWIN